ncbi:MAG: tagaturonate epimerase family protein [Planctomycetota bacterium]|nr:tagaturonate epimerase family protein [Planctomycetota bacterium]
MKDLRKFSREIARFAEAAGLCVYPESLTVEKDAIFAIARKGIEKHLLVLSPDDRTTSAFSGAGDNVDLEGAKAVIKVCPLGHDNAAAVRKHLPFTAPTVLGVKKTIGTGDRLGVATPGHVLAVKQGNMRPVLAMQSIREMARTERTPQEVMDAACWGVLQSGYQAGYGADADHLKNTDDIDRCFKAGYTLYTVDPGEFVDGSAEDASPAKLREKFDALPWGELESGPDECISNYAEKSTPLKSPAGEFKLEMSGEDLLRSAVKYGRAVAHVVTMYRYLQGLFAGQAFDYEISVDETARPTSIAEHYYIASELKRLGARWHSLAPRFVGEFEKGVDYIGDLDLFRSEFAQHVAIARYFGPYKISLHSGSDKFKIYPAVAELAEDLVYLKTAGTSYLEALRTLAEVDPQLFGEILTFAKDRYPEDKATYHVSADLRKTIDLAAVDNKDLPGALDQFDTRQVCHVTFGSVLTAKDPGSRFLFKDRMLKSLKENEQAYYRHLEKHLGRHVKPFS